jgi:hydrogenase maturation protease
MRYLIGVGNYTMADDAIGLKIIEYIDQHQLNPDFEAIDLSSNYLNLFSYFNTQTKKILIVDCALMGKKPGEYAFFSPAEAQNLKQHQALQSSHQGDLLKALELAPAGEYPVPPLEIMGIEPAFLQEYWGLSPTLEKNLPHYVQAAIERLRRD